MRANSLRILAILLIVVGIGVAVVGYLRATAPEPVEVNDKTAEDREQVAQRVVVASRAIEAGALIEASDIDVSKRSVRDSDDSANFLSAPGEVLGRRALLNVAQGDVITADLLAEPPQVTPLAGAVSPGHKALAIEVNEIESAGGYLVPGDKVDLIWFLDHRDADGPYARTLVREVRVLAFGEVLDQADAGPDDSRDQGLRESARNAVDGSPPGQVEKKDAFDRQPRARSVVLELGDEHVSRVLLAARTGQIRLAVHSAESTGDVGEERARNHPEGDGNSLATLLGTTRTEPPETQARPAEPAPEKVRVFRGPDPMTVEVD